PFSGRTPWPNAVAAVRSADLAVLAETNGRPDMAAVARSLGPGKMLLSKMMARRFRVGPGDQMELSGKGGTRRLEVVAVTDGLGFWPVVGPYRNAKTYGVIDEADYDLIAPYAGPVGAAAVVAHVDHPAVQAWWAGLRRGEARGLRFPEAKWFRWLRLRETDKDFVI